MNNPLKITFVVDTYGLSTNGTTMTAMRSVKALREKGHSVKVLTGSSSNGERLYSTGYRKWFPLYQISRSQGMYLAKAKKNVIKAAIEDSDVVHLLLPFKLQKKAKKMANRMGIATTAAFHLQPENVTSTLRLERFNLLNNALYRIFRRFYDQFTHVRCPSEMIAKELRKRHYTSNLHVISNGVSLRFKPEPTQKPASFEDKHVLLMIGRFSREKRQDLVIEAVKKSEHEAHIQIVFAGKGPNRKTIESMGKKLTNQPIMAFYEQDELQKVINYSDLYVHASDIEIEAISCIEAFSCGLVPIISDSEKSATNQFALSEANLFEKNTPSDLAEKIDYLLNHPNEREALSKSYIEYAKRFTLEKSTERLERMFYQALNDHQNKNHS
ncbi:MAG: glycosyltransferase [Bacillota bacterium]